MIPYKQLSVTDIFQDCQDKFENDKPVFLSLLESHIDIDEIIPISFRNHFYASTGRTRKYPLHAFLWNLILQRIFSIPYAKQASCHLSTAIWQIRQNWLPYLSLLVPPDFTEKRSEIFVKPTPFSQQFAQMHLSPCLIPLQTHHKLRFWQMRYRLWLWNVGNSAPGEYSQLCYPIATLKFFFTSKAILPPILGQIKQNHCQASWQCPQRLLQASADSDMASHQYVLPFPVTVWGKPQVICQNVESI